jgi:predicted acylesterase/phospholipase RssA
MATKPVKEAQERHVSATRELVLIDLALQGGGSHGAFTWGVLDRLWMSRGCASTEYRARRRAR